MKKTKRMLAILLALVICLSLAVIPAGAAALTDYTADGTMTELASGNKTAAGTYSISSATELKALSSWVNSGHTGEGFTFYLTGDVALGGKNDPLTPIGQYDSTPTNNVAPYPFKGTFDGCGHYIENLYVEYDSAHDEAVSLFGVNSGVIRNVKVSGEIKSYRCGAFIVGHNEGTIEYCASSGTINESSQGSHRGAGGIAGYNTGTIRSCTSDCTIINDTKRRTGGIAGYNEGTITSCYFAGKAGTDAKYTSTGYSGGITASNAYASDGKITNCYYLDGSSADNAAYWQAPQTGSDFTKTAGTTFNAAGFILDNGTATATTLLSSLNSDGNGAFKAAPDGGLPIYRQL